MASADAVEIDGIYYNFKYNTAEVTSDPHHGKYTGSVIIPETVTYEGTDYRVTSIGNSAFNFCTDLTSVTIPNSVTKIDYYAFESCRSLTSIIIPSSVTSILERAFADCSALTSIIVEEGNSKYDSRNNCNAIIEKSTNTLIAGCQNTIIPNSVTGIGQFAFKSCHSLTSITIPNSVTSIGKYAFQGCTGLTSVTIPKRVTSINSDAFQSCTALTSIIVEEGNSSYDSRNNCNAIIRTSTNSLIVGCKNTTIPNGVTSIGKGAFWQCTGLTSITIPNSVTWIGEDAFYRCTGLTSITVESENENYDSRNNCNAIVNTSTNSLILGCKNTIIPNSVTSIGYEAFCYCSDLNSVIIPNSVIRIGEYAFLYCSGLTSITIGNSVTSIGESAFCGCEDLSSVTFGNSVTSIGKRCFCVCPGLTSIVIPNSVTSIEESAFAGCSGLSFIRIGSGVTSIGKGAFGGADFSTVISLIENPSIINGKTSPDFKTFSLNTFDNATLYVPNGTLEKYKTTKGWKDFEHIVEGIPSGIRTSKVEKKVVTKSYTIDGKVLDKPQKGLNIVKMSDGTTRKVIVK